MADQSEELEGLRELVKRKSDELATVKTTLETTILKQTDQLGQMRSKLMAAEKNIRVAVEEAVEEEHQMLEAVAFKLLQHCDHVCQVAEDLRNEWNQLKISCSGAEQSSQIKQASPSPVLDIPSIKHRGANTFKESQRAMLTPRKE